MKPRYNLVLTGTCTGGATSENFTFTYDLKQLLPLSDRKKQFLIYSSFDSTNNWGTGQLAACQVYSTLFSRTYKKDITASDYVLMGVGAPRLAYSTNNFTFHYKQNECIPVVYEYPDANYSPTITIRLSTAVALPAGSWIICLTFVEID